MANVDEVQRWERWRRIASGEIPWSLEGFLAAVTFRERLMKTPCDDWDLAPGNGEAITLNPLKLEVQLFRFLVRQHGYEVGGSHWFRFIEILALLNRYRGQLTHLGFIRDGENLLQALVELPYSRQRKDGTRTFDPDDVLRRAAEIERSC